ncbi:hypothetical protein EN824_21095 [Mesorhizobium sp. M8A.F.Ca.ET.181.01.1.1]|nr:hypothetical protein EN825_23685 [Mesorhizobium sp. M8A.F.Ca.ET.182.01.1.1]TGS78818.1 hypothetical protein EN824_21095 [Mesorhizobium sp. M8A.F.Ca.ET.181.01.1.1]
MIVTTVRHGRTARDTQYLLAHLSKEQGQRSRVVHVAAPTGTAPEALTYMEALRDGSRATVAYHHISLNPSEALTDDQREEAVVRVLAAMGAEDHAHVVWEHSEKPRRGSAVKSHYHLVVSNVGPDGKALDDGRSFVRLEAAARALEHDFGHSLTPGRRTAAVTAELEYTGRADVAARVRCDAPPEPPQSSMSSRQRARADRHGLSLPDVREAVQAAWAASDSPAALRAALAERGLSVAAGDKAGVWIVTTGDGQTLGSLDRLARVKRHDVAARMTQEGTHDREDPARDASLESDFRRGPPGPGGSRSAGPAASPAGPAGGGGRESLGRGDGPPRNDPSDAGKDARSDRAADRSYRRGQALAGVALARAARSAEVRANARRLRKRFRQRGRDSIAVHRLARVDLDELRRLAEAIGRRIAALLTRLEPPPETRAAVLARVARDYESRLSRPRNYASGTVPEQDPAPAYRPRF